jgi:hypothetical protein
MSNGSPAPTVGSWVQYNVSTQSPLAGLPTSAEETIGIVRQLFTAQGTQYAQVVWNPGSSTPETGLYTADQLCAITSQQAADIQCQMNSGDFTPPTRQEEAAVAGQDYQQPAVPTGALPPALQTSVPVIPTLTGPQDTPLTQGAGYQ